VAQQARVQAHAVLQGIDPGRDRRRTAWAAGQPL